MRDFDIKEGVRYVRRDGSVTAPLIPDYADCNSGYLVDPESDLCYDPTDCVRGHFVFSYCDTEYDLVSEHEGEKV